MSNTREMKPIEIKVTGFIRKSSQEICAEFLRTERWQEFQGYSILPGIKSASFETKTPGLVGSRIKVENTDGSSHIEEIVNWDTENRIAMRFQEFASPLQNLTSHFLEEWEFHRSADGTTVLRKMTMYPKGTFGWMMLLPISGLMKKAFQKNLTQYDSQF